MDLQMPLNLVTTDQGIWAGYEKLFDPTGRASAAGTNKPMVGFISHSSLLYFHGCLTFLTSVFCCETCCLRQFKIVYALASLAVCLKGAGAEMEKFMADLTVRAQCIATETS